MELKKTFSILVIVTSLFFIISFENVFAVESKTIEIEIKYTNRDIVDHNGIKIIVFQDFNKKPILEKELEGNPDFISVEENHRYKIETYVNGMYADTSYIQLDTDSKKLNIAIPISGGIQFEVYYEDQNPIKGATVVLKSQDNSEWRKGLTNDQGQTMRFWIQSTTKQEDHYIADVYLGDIFLTSYFPIKLQPGIATNQKIITNIPKIVEDLISINLYDGAKKITSDDGNYQVTLIDSQGKNVITSNVNFRGDAQFSNLKSGTYSIKITTDNPTENSQWPQNNIHIIGDLNKFNIYKYTKEFLDKEKPFRACNCVAFRLDDIQDYWLDSTQSEIIKIFGEKKIPLTVGVIGNLIGTDQKVISAINEGIEKNQLEIANHSWNNEIMEGLSKAIQEKYIVDTNQKIFETFGIKPTSFIPPRNLYDENTVEILKKNGFTHLISHIRENSETYFEGNFYNVPATTETGVLVNGIIWELNTNQKIKEDITNSIDQRGYAIIMMHPQDFTINNDGVFGEPNQESLLKLRTLLDEVSELDSEIVKISDVKNSHPDTEDHNETKNESIINNNTVEDAVNKNIIETCNCVAFRLNDVQDYWLNDVQIKIMETFIENDTPLTIGIIADAFGNDQKITEFIKQDKSKHLEIATKGIGLTPFTNYDKTEQNKNLKESLDLIESDLNVRPKVFIPPNNKFNSDTLEILEENNITHISSSLINGDSPPFEFKGEKFYRFPQTTSTGKYDTAKNIFEGLPSQHTLLEATQSIENYGFTVISINPQEFSMIENSVYTNSINEKQFDELKTLINEIKEKGYKIVPIGKINSNLVVVVPEWIKNNAGWWADDQIDDNTFVQGIEYLINEKIINIPETELGERSGSEIPEWIKNNAGWWADEQIDDNTFVQGIEYLVKNGIIAY